MTTDDAEIPSAAVAELLDQFDASAGSDPNLVAILNTAQAGRPSGMDDPSGLAAQLKIDVAGYAAALETLATVRQISLDEFLADGRPADPAAGGSAGDT